MLVKSQILKSENRQIQNLCKQPNELRQMTLPSYALKWCIFGVWSSLKIISWDSSDEFQYVVYIKLEF